jgi:hypothetical protein
VVSTANTPNDTWHDLQGVWDGTDLKLFINGIERGSAAMASMDNTGNNTLTVGNINNSSSSRAFNGLIDEIRVYTKALSARELEHVRNKSL